MISSHRSFGVALLTLGELAWVALFGVLLGMKDMETELATGKTQVKINGQTLVELAEKTQVQAEQLQRTATEAFWLRSRLETNQSAFAAKLREVEAERNKAQDENAWLRERIAETQTDTVPPSREEKRNLQESLDRVKPELERAKAQIAVLQKELQNRHADEFSIRREITGLPDGPLHRVAILVDTSSSMHGSSSWTQVQRLIRTWVTYLPIEECVLITFDDTVRCFPQGEFLRLRQPGTQVVIKGNQQKLLSRFDETPLGTWTDTYTALKAAYELPKLDLILLFSDGKPQVRSHPYHSLAAKISNLVKLHPGIPILTVALGDYERLEAEDRRAGVALQIQFLKSLAAQTHGAFVGR